MPPRPVALLGTRDTSQSLRKTCPPRCTPQSQRGQDRRRSSELVECGRWATRILPDFTTLQGRSRFEKTRSQAMRFPRVHTLLYHICKYLPRPPARQGTHFQDGLFNVNRTLSFCFSLLSHHSSVTTTRPCYGKIVSLDHLSVVIMHI